jgi:hypothetical protein
LQPQNLKISMRIGPFNNSTSCEWLMQSKLRDWLAGKELKFIDEYKIPEAKRIPDFLVIKPGYGLLNIEAKCNAFECLSRQLEDNSIFCDYSFAYIPDISLTPKWFKNVLTEKGYGLIVFNYRQEIITEVLEAHQNKGIDKNLRKIVLARIDRELILRKKKHLVDIQQKLI